MTYEEKERLIHIISWNKLLFNDQIILRTPTLEENARASYLYKKELNNALDNGLSRDDELIQDMIKIGKWTDKYEDQIDGLKKDINNIRKSLLDLIFFQSKLNYTRSLLRNAEKVLIDKLVKRKSVLSSSAESCASLQYQSYIIYCVTQNDDGRQFWPSQEHFDNDYDVNLINNLRRFYFEKSRLDFSVLRKLARTDPWRSRWEISKNTGQLFLNTINEWSYNQQELVHWSLIYDSVYASIDRPSQDVIEDDDLLDSWLIRQNEKTARNSKQPTNKTKSSPQEQFVFSDKNGSKNVYKMNDIINRSKIIARQKSINKNKIINEQHLPDVQAELRNVATTSRTKDIRRKN